MYIFFFRPFLIVLGILIVLLLVLLFAGRLMGKKLAIHPVLFLFSTAIGFSFLGVTVGIFVGNSRESAVNTTISASMTFLGGMIVYLFTRKDPSVSNFSLKLNNSFFVAIICLITFPICLLYGALIGGTNRQTTEEYDKSVDINYQLQLKNDEYSLKATEDSIKTFLEIYKDTIVTKKR